MYLGSHILQRSELATRQFQTHLLDQDARRRVYSTVVVTLVT